MDTIYALASAPGRAGISVLRISGPDAVKAASAIAGPLPPPRQAALRKLVHEGDVLDEALVLRFGQGASFTGEDVVELHLHGSRAVVTAVQAALGTQPGLRMAEPGEFTRRALENDRLDIARIEGLADLVDAETEAQRRQALRVFSGEIGRRAEDWRAALVRAAALIEAVIDFADEEVPTDVLPEVRQLVEGVQADLRREIAGFGAAERVRDGFEVAIVGPPNTGKSTLLNAIAGREAALTSEVAGTTRDVIEVRLDLGGLPVTLLDTAGLRETTDAVEALGVERARERAAAADLRVFLLDQPGDAPADPPAPGDIVLPGKADLHGSGVSGLTGRGVSELLDRIAAQLSDRASGGGIAIRERHRIAIRSAEEALRDVLAAIEAGEPEELVAARMRDALRALDSLVGRVDVEHLLDEIFASFCIGK